MSCFCLLVLVCFGWLVGGYVVVTLFQEVQRGVGILVVLLLLSCFLFCVRVAFVFVFALRDKCFVLCCGCAPTLRLE